MELQQAYDLFMNDRGTFCSDRTLLYYRENLDSFIAFVGGGNQDINALDIQIFNNYVKQLRKRKRFATDDRNIKNSTIRTYCRAVKTFLNFCIAEGYLKQEIKIGKLPRDDSAQITPLYDFEVSKIDALFKLRTETGHRNYLLVHLMLDMGLRSGEVINLKVSDVMFDKNFLLIENSKYNKSRMVPLPPDLKNMLYDYVCVFRRVALDSKDSLFHQLVKNEPINDNVIKQLFKRIRINSGVSHVHPHLLRHTFATSFIMGGGSMEVLRLLMGHADYDVTQRYLHVATQYNILDAKIHRLDPIFFKTAY